MAVSYTPSRVNASTVMGLDVGVRRAGSILQRLGTSYLPCLSISALGTHANSNPQASGFPSAYAGRGSNPLLVNLFFHLFHLW